MIFVCYLSCLLMNNFEFVIDFGVFSDLNRSSVSLVDCILYGLTTADSRGRGQSNIYIIANYRSD